MGTGIRFFFVDEKENLIKIPTSKIERFLRGEPNISFPQFKGKRLRYALITLELENRKAIGIIDEDYGYILFTEEGMYDREYARSEVALALERMGADFGFDFIKHPEMVIRRQAEFGEKILKNRYRWTPSQSLREAIREAAYG